MSKKFKLTALPVQPQVDAGASTEKTTRKVVSRSPHRSVGIMACSWFQDRGIEYESQLERKFLQRALLCLDIKHIQHQPFKIAYEIDGETLKYTPDFLVTMWNETRLIIEVKPATFVNKNRALFDAAREILRANDLTFIVATEKNLGSKATMANASLLLRYARGSAPDVECQRCMNILREVSPIPMSTLISKAEIALTTILHLIGRRQIAINPDLDLNPETLLSLPNQGEQNGLIFFCDWFNTTPW